MIIETGQEAIFYASFETPDGEKAKIVNLPTVELFLGNESIFKSNMQRERKRFFLKKKLDNNPGNYLIVYSAIDIDGVNLQGEESLTLVKKDPEINKIGVELNKFEKLYKGDCNSIIKKLKEMSANGEVLKRMLTKLLPSEKIEELLKEEKP